MEIQIQISKINYNLAFVDLGFGDSPERIVHMQGYAVEYYLNKYIKSTIDIPTNKELTIVEIKERIKEVYKEEI